jgi:hypothetical protein
MQNSVLNFALIEVSFSIQIAAVAQVAGRI